MNDRKTNPDNTSEEHPAPKGCGTGAAENFMRAAEMASTNAAPKFDFNQLSEGASVVLIRVNEFTYTLRKTGAGKLVLNK